MTRRLPAVAVFFVAVTAACSARFQPVGGAGSTGIRSGCYVEIYNATDVALDVTYTIRASQRTRSVRLGVIRAEQTRTITAECGSWVEAIGVGGGTHAQGGAVAGPRGESTIVLR